MPVTTGIQPSTSKKLPKPFLPNGALYRLEKQFVDLARQSSSRRCKKRGDATFRSLDLAWDRQTDRQTHTHKHSTSIDI